MSRFILVTYATFTGSTAGVAAEIGKTLEQYGYIVDVRPMSQVKDVAGYDAVVAGSAIHDKKWLPEAIEFIETHRAALRQRPFAAFLVCMTLALRNQKWAAQANVQSWLAPIRTIVPTVAEGTFAGSLDLKQVPQAGIRRAFRISVWLKFWKEGDHRDWEAIRAWANALPQQLFPVAA